MWYGIVNSKYLFSTIVKSIQEVAKENNFTPEKRKKVHTSTNSASFNRTKNSKFSRRFQLGGSGISTEKKEERVGTPSTAVSESIVINQQKDAPEIEESSPN